MGLLDKNFGYILCVFLVISFSFSDCIAAPSGNTNNRNLSQSHDEEQLTTPGTNNGRRQRFILRRSSTPSPSTVSSLIGHNRKRHLQTPDPHFQPVQDGVPKENIQPFLEFGQKLITTSTNSIADLKQTTTTPNYSRVIINIEHPTSPNSISSTDSKEIITIISTPQPTPSILRLITLRSSSSTTTQAPSQNDENDIMTNSNQRRRRKKLIARRLQLNNITEVITDHVMNDTVMNAALVRRKTLLQQNTQRPNNNTINHQSLIRRPLIRITKNLTDSIAQESSTVNISDTTTTVFPKLHNESINNSKNHTISINPSSFINFTINDVLKNKTIENTETTVSRVEISTRSTTTSLPLYIRNNTIFNGTAFIPILPITRFNSSTRFNYNIETTTRKAWRPTSTTVKPSTTTQSSTTSTSTTAKITTEKQTTTIKPIVVVPVKETSRLPPSETTFFSGDTQPSTEFTAKPNLGASVPTREDEDDSPGISVATYALVSLALVTAVGVASYGARYLASRRRRMLDESELSSSESSSVAGATLKRGPPGSTEELTIPPRLTQGWPDKSTVTPPPPHPQWHFPRDQLRLQTVLGQGNFGQVWKAEAENICGIPGTRLVAVKSTKSGAGDREKSDLLRELAIMQQLGAHPNVVTLLGCCTEQEPHLLIMEYVMYGKLLTFLRDHRTRRDCLHFSSSDDGGEQALTSRDLTHFAYCVAKGMDYLVSRGIIHRDLAARNVLVDHNKQCKIADFGMSRHARDSSGQVYEPKQKGALPIRWMAPESLVRSVFTHRSDVWSFGILMWEIVTLGSTPYPTMGAREVMRRVREGYRLERPTHCRPELFRVVASCWTADPSRRPDFAELRVELRRLRDEGAACPGGGHVDLLSALPPPSPINVPNTAAPTPCDPM